MAFERIGVERPAAVAVLPRDHLGPGELAEALHPEPVEHLRAERPRARDAGPHRHAAHMLDARGDHHVLRARHHRLRGEVDRLLRAAALAVDAHRGHRWRQRRRQHAIAPDVQRLLARLADAAHDDVVDRRGIHAGALGHRRKRRAAQVVGMPSRQPPVAAPAGGAHRRDDIGFGHDPLPARLHRCK